MPVAVREFEGTWEEVLGHASELAGRRVRVTVFDETEADRKRRVDEKQEKMLEWLRERERNPLTDEERQVLDDFEAFRKEHPFRLRRLDQEE